MSDPSLFDALDAAWDDRDAGAGQALGAEAVATWRTEARIVLEYLAGTRQPFTVDDVLERTGLPHAVGVNANNAVGALLLRANQTGLIFPTGRRVPTRRRSNHGRYVTEWAGRT